MPGMNIFGGKSSMRSADTGREIPGMISAYLLQFEDGTYFKGYAGDDKVKIISANSWDEAGFYFGTRGLSTLREIQRRFGGTIMIVNCTQIKPYYQQ